MFEEDGASSTTKRTSESASLDIELDELMGRLGNLQHSEPDEQLTKFVEVIGCSMDEAKFYLESAEFNVERAVEVYLQLRHSSNGGAFGSAFHGPSGMPKRARTHELAECCWYPRTVEIIGLPTEWRAHVSASYGNIIFEHIESGHTQSHVPPGFADAPTGPPSASSIKSADADDADGGSMTATTTAAAAAVYATAMEATETGSEVMPAVVAAFAAPAAAVPTAFAFAAPRFDISHNAAAAPALEHAACFEGTDGDDI